MRMQLDLCTFFMILGYNIQVRVVLEHLASGRLKMKDKTPKVKPLEHGSNAADYIFICNHYVSMGYLIHKTKDQKMCFCTWQSTF